MFYDGVDGHQIKALEAELEEVNRCARQYEEELADSQSQDLQLLDSQVRNFFLVVVDVWVCCEPKPHRHRCLHVSLRVSCGSMWLGCKVRQIIVKLYQNTRNKIKVQMECSMRF